MRRRGRGAGGDRVVGAVTGGGVGRGGVALILSVALASCAGSGGPASVVATTVVGEATASTASATSTVVVTTAPATTTTTVPATTTTTAPPTTVAVTTTLPVTTTEVTDAPVRIWTLLEVKEAIGRGRVWFDETGDRTCPGYDLPRPTVRTSDDNDDEPHFEVRVFSDEVVAEQYFTEWVRLISDSGMTAVTCRRNIETTFSAGLAEPNGDGSYTLGYRFSLLPEIRLTGVLHRCGNVVVQTVPASNPARLC